MVDDEMVDNVKIFSLLSIHLFDDTVLEFEAGFGIERALHVDQSHLRPLMDTGVLVHSPLGQ
jgi:hypothetical protein